MVENLDKCAYSYSHGIDEKHDGLFSLYQSLAYTNKSKICVVLGSGGGIVPMAFREAQRALGYGQTYLVDAYQLDEVNSDYGSPLEEGGWALEDSLMLKNYPEIVLYKTTTDVASQVLNSIDILHIDAEHSYEAVLQDYEYFKHALFDNAIVTFHDTQDKGVQQAVYEIADKYNYDALHLRDMASGLSILRKSFRDGYTHNLYDDCSTRPEGHKWTLGPGDAKTWGSK